MRFSGAGVTDVGRARPHNEDSAYVGPYVAVVADGVGGAAAGEIASACAAHVVSGGFLRRPAQDPASLLEDLVALAARVLTAEIAADPSRAGMATTLTAVATDGQRMALAHSGDSRAYLVRDQRLVRLTRDHTYVQQLVDEGLISPEGAHHHPWRHVVLRSLPGSAHTPLAEVGMLDLLPGDRLLLCTDGLTDVLEDCQVSDVLQLPHAQSAAARLVDSALRAGAPDNVTAVVVDVVLGPEVSGEGMPLGALEEYAGPSLPVANELGLA